MVDYIKIKDKLKRQKKNNILKFMFFLTWFDSFLLPQFFVGSRLLIRCKINKWKKNNKKKKKNMC